MRLLAILTVVFVAIPASAASPFDDGFAGDAPGDFLEGGFPVDQVKITRLDGVNALSITDTKVHFKPARVTPNTKYTLSLVGCFTGQVESLEDNPRLAVCAQPRRTSRVLPSREIQFFDDDGERTGQTFLFAMPLREQHRYADVFYTPLGAVSLRLSIASGEGIQLAMRNLSLEPTTDEGAINVNPAFELGSLNYSGWKNISAGGKIIEMNGKTVFDTKYGSRGTTFPLPEPGTYALSVKATGNGYNSCVKVDIFDAEGKKLMAAVLRRYDQTEYFVPPPEAVSASLLVYSCLLEEVRLVRIGDENEIERHSN